MYLLVANAGHRSMGNEVHINQRSHGTSRMCNTSIKYRVSLLAAALKRQSRFDMDYLRFWDESSPSKPFVCVPKKETDEEASRDAESEHCILGGKMSRPRTL